MKKRVIFALLAVLGFSSACFPTRRVIEKAPESRATDPQVEEKELPFVAMYGVRPPVPVQDATTAVEVVEVEESTVVE